MMDEFPTDFIASNSSGRRKSMVTLGNRNEYCRPRSNSINVFDLKENYSAEIRPPPSNYEPFQYSSMKWEHDFPRISVSPPEKIYNSAQWKGPKCNVTVQDSPPECKRTKSELNKQAVIGWLSLLFLLLVMGYNVGKIMVQVTNYRVLVRTRASQSKINFPKAPAINIRSIVEKAKNKDMEARRIRQFNQRSIPVVVGQSEDQKLNKSDVETVTSINRVKETPGKPDFEKNKFLQTEIKNGNKLKADGLPEVQFSRPTMKPPERVNGPEQREALKIQKPVSRDGIHKGKPHPNEDLRHTEREAVMKNRRPQFMQKGGGRSDLNFQSQEWERRRIPLPPGVNPRIYARALEF